MPSSQFIQQLHVILPVPCFDRPFVCVWHPESCHVIVIGENPASETDVDWWTFWSDLKGFDYRRWEEMYTQRRRDQGKKNFSPTRRRIIRLRGAGINCLETNAFRNERLQGHGQGKGNDDLLNLAINTLPNISAIVAHGKVADTYVAFHSIPSRIHIFKTRHLRLLSFEAVDELAATLRAVLVEPRPIKNK